MRKSRPRHNMASPRASLRCCVSSQLLQGSSYGGMATRSVADLVQLDTDHSPPDQKGQSRDEGCSYFSISRDLGSLCKTGAQRAGRLGDAQEPLCFHPHPPQDALMPAGVLLTQDVQHRVFPKHDEVPHHHVAHQLLQLGGRENRVSGMPGLCRSPFMWGTTG